MRTILGTACFSLCILLVLPDQAQGSPPQPVCGIDDFLGKDSITLGRVHVGDKERAYFYSSDKGCPDPTTTACRRKQYLVKGDIVLVAQVSGAFRCVWFQPKPGKRGTIGWIPSGYLAAAETPAAKPSDFVGAWDFLSNTIEIKASGAALSVSGVASWVGGEGDIHSGSIDASGRAEGRWLRVADGDCELAVMSLGPFLVAQDNDGCGGANVTFNGVYLRRR